MRVISLEKTGPNIKEKIKTAGFTFKRISEEVGVNPQAVYKWAYGNSLPTIDNLVILAYLLGVTIDELIITEDV